MTTSTPPVLSGQTVLDIPRVVSFVTPNLTTTKYTDAELFILLRAENSRCSRRPRYRICTPVCRLGR